MIKDKKARGSEAGFMMGRLVFTDYDTACLRKIYLRARGVRQPIPEIHTKRGPIYEQHVGSELTKTIDVADVRPELPVIVPIDGFAGFNFSGRMDYCVADDGGSVIYELKSTESKNVLRQIKQGIYKTENLAQLISYMIAKGTDRGWLCYGYMEKDKVTDQYKVAYERKFKINVDEYGRILVDSRPSRFTVYDQIAHTQHVAKVIDGDEIWDRPYGYSNAFGSPCSYCPFKDTCEKWDNGEIELVDDFVNIAKSQIKE